MLSGAKHLASGRQTRSTRGGSQMLRLQTQDGSLLSCIYLVDGHHRGSGPSVTTRRVRHRPTHALPVPGQLRAVIGQCPYRRLVRSWLTQRKTWLRAFPTGDRQSSEAPSPAEAPTMAPPPNSDTSTPASLERKQELHESWCNPPNLWRCPCQDSLRELRQIE